MLRITTLLVLITVQLPGFLSNQAELKVQPWTHIRMASTVGVVNFDDVKNIKSTGEYLIDVRERDELRETGTIPESINIPLGEVEDALTKMDTAIFKQKYGREKPDFDTKIVFSCKSGRRGDMAAQLALKLGFKEVRNYSGGWLDWESNLKKN